MTYKCLQQSTTAARNQFSNNNNNRKPIKKGHLENFIKVPTATTDTNLFPALEITSGITIPDEKYKRTKELEKNQRIIVRKRYSRPKLKSKRHSKERRSDVHVQETRSDQLGNKQSGTSPGLPPNHD